MPAKRRTKSISALFIGNSFTARNDLPGMIARLAAARGHELRHRLINRGGASLRMHWNSGAPQKALAEGKFDLVVLQEQSTLPVKNAARMHESVRLLDAAIRDAGAKTVLYQTWARAHAPEAQKLITDAYVSIGKEIGATVVPAGEAWRNFLSRRLKTPVLHDKDGSHPTPAGTYLAACAFLVTLFGEDPTGLEMEIAGVSSEDARPLQQAARDVTE